MNARTTLVDRRLATVVLEGIPDLPEDVVKHHLRHKEALHKGLRDLLCAPMPRAFKPGTLEAVQAQGGQFAQAQLTSVPGGETLDSQKRNQTIKFWSAWRFERSEQDKLEIEPSLGSEVIYLPGLVEGSLRCTFDKIEGRDSVEDVLNRLPKVEGVRWIIGNSPTVTRVLANHLKETGKGLLPESYTWTTDKYHWSFEGFRRLVVGSFDSDGVGVFRYPPGGWGAFVGLFVLGVPS